MKKVSFGLRWGVLTLLALTLAVGFVATERSQTFGMIPIEPQCGPTFRFSCSVPGCPSCPDVLLIGTQCDKFEFEKETGRVCTPF